MERYTLYVDGGSRGNPGPAGYGAVIVDAGGQEHDRLMGALSKKTNNEAEYLGLIAGLKALRAIPARRVLVRADSELMVRQMQGRYQVRSPQLRPLYAEAKELAGEFDAFEIEHIPRERNREADRLANLAMDRAAAGKTAAAGASPPSGAPARRTAPEFIAGVIEAGAVRLLDAPPWPEGTRVRVRKA